MLERIDLNYRSYRSNRMFTAFPICPHPTKVGFSFGTFHKIIIFISVWESNPNFDGTCYTSSPLDERKYPIIVGEDGFEPSKLQSNRMFTAFPICPHPTLSWFLLWYSPQSMADILATPSLSNCFKVD